MDYTSTASGAVLKLVRCEQCAAEYVYQMQRTATGGGTSLLFLDNEGAADRAAARAEQSLQRKLERGVDLVPCPACGWYQQTMFVKARRQYRRWMLYAGLCLTLGLIPVSFIGAVINAGPRDVPKIPWPLYFAGVLVLAAVGIALIVAKFILAARYDPNKQDVEHRKRVGQERALLRKDFERMLKRQQEAPDEER
jgi:hypothetical protein